MLKPLVPAEIHACSDTIVFGKDTTSFLQYLAFDHTLHVIASREGIGSVKRDTPFRSEDVQRPWSRFSRV